MVRDSLFDRTVQLENLIDELRQDGEDRAAAAEKQLGQLTKRLDRRIDALEDRMSKLDRRIQGLMDQLIAVQKRAKEKR
jgi:predicted  nucleic acid-binding Zn-ribbon protein